MLYFATLNYFYTVRILFCFKNNYNVYQLEHTKMSNYHSILNKGVQCDFLSADLDGTITPIPSLADHWLWTLLASWMLRPCNFWLSILGRRCITYQSPKQFLIRLNEPEFQQTVFLDLAPENSQCRLRVGACWKWAVCYFQELANAHQRLQTKMRKETAQRILREKLDKIVDIFPFDKLPGEIKMQIYRYALELDEDADAIPYRYTTKPLSQFGKPLTDAPQATSLLRTSKSVWSEASSLLYSNVFYFSSPKLLEKFLTQLTPESRATIKKIHLEFGHEDLLCLFGFLGQHPRCDPNFANLRTLLQGMNLDHFKVYLPHPFRMQYAGFRFEHPACHMILVRFSPSVLLSVRR